MLKSYKYRLYPTKAQAELLDKHFDACRFVYNLALETKIRAYKDYGVSLSKFDLTKQIPELKRDCVFLREVQASSLQSSLLRVFDSYKRFFKGQTQFPKFKKKSHCGSFCMPVLNNLRVRDNKIFIPKFHGGIRIVWGKKPPIRIRKRLTFSKTPTGKYFVSILYDISTLIPNKKTILQETTIGIDLGIKTFAVTSDGDRYIKPAHLVHLSGRLAILQRRASRKVKGSANRRKANLKVALLHEKIANQRKDFLHKLSTNLINSHDTICLERLIVSDMIKNRNLARLISDAGWYEFARQLQYKADWYGKNIIRIGQFEPSSKTCNVCGRTNKDLKLSHREWACECGEVHDRDLNAAINIRNIGISGKAFPVEPLELPTMVGAVKKEGLELA